MEKNQKQRLEKFKELIAQSCFFDREEMKQFETIPDSYFEKIFENNFNDNLELASKIMFDNFDEIYDGDLISDYKKIKNYKEVVDTVINALETNKPIILITDTDNDGSLSQAVTLEFKRINPVDNIEITYAQELNGNSNRGFTVDLVDYLFKKNGYDIDQEIVVMTADNGINSLDEQVKINEKYKNVKLIITDHHTPNEGIAIVENNNTMVFNPKYKPTGIFETEKNISGAHTLGLIWEAVYEHYNPNAKDKLSGIYNLERIANMLDYVNADIRSKPYKSHIAEKYIDLGVLMNVNNSVINIVQNEFDSNVLYSIFKDEEDVDLEEIKEAVLSIKTMNLLAKKILDIKLKYEKNYKITQYLNLDVFNLDFTNSLLKEEYEFSSNNNNYIAQLRPFIYYYSNLENINDYESGLLNKMLDIYSNVQNEEKRIIKQISGTNIVESIKKDNVTVLVVRNPDVSKLFSKKLLMKAYNENNRGVLLVLNSIKGNKYTGSYRGLHNHQSLTNGKTPDFLFEFIGHGKAAGAFITASDADLDSNIEKMINYFNGQISKLNNSNQEVEKFLLMNFSNFHVIKKINTKVKSYLNNMEVIKPLVKLNRSFYFTNQRTQEVESLQSIIKEKQYGYIPMVLNFQGDVMIVPTEIVRQLEANNFKDYLQFNYLNNGVFMADKVIEANTLKASQIIKLPSSIEENQKHLSNYYEEHFLNKNTYEKTLTREVLSKTEIYSRNSFGVGEFNKTEEFILKMMDKLGLEKYIIVDTEANGLGKAPKLFNYGALEIYEKPNSGQIYDEDVFKEMINDPIQRILFKKTIRNITYDKSNKKVIVNREIEAKLLTYLISENDFKVSQEIQALTSINQSMLNKYGIKTAEFDKMMHERYKNSGKLLFQAHNSNYDIGVLFASTPLLKDVIDRNLICDSAKFSKDFRLAYADTKVSSLSGYAPYSLFFDDGVSDYSLSMIIKSEGDFVFPDIRNEYRLERKGDNYFLLNLSRQERTLLTGSKEEILSSISRKEIPLNRVKYSVVSLAQYDCIRSMMLNDIREKVIIVNKNEIETNPLYKELKISELMLEIQEGYHLDKSPELNIYLFEEFLLLNRRNDDYDLMKSNYEIMVDTARLKKDGSYVQKKKLIPIESVISEFLTEKFLSLNKDLYGKYNLSWEYKKVLDVYDPEKPTLTKEQVSGLQYKTGLPENKLREIAKEIFDYKKEHNLLGHEFYVPELHNNIDEKGDVCLESFLTIKRLMNRFYNQYSKNFDTAIGKFIECVEDTTMKSVIRKNMDDDMSIFSENSYSVAQLRSFGNRTDDEGNLHVSNLVAKSRGYDKVYFKARVLNDGNTGYLVRAKENYISGKIDSKSFKIIENAINFIIASNLVLDTPKEGVVGNMVEKVYSKYEKKLKGKEELISDISSLISSKNDPMIEINEKMSPKASQMEEVLENMLGGLFFDNDKKKIKEISRKIWDTLKTDKIVYETYDGEFNQFAKDTLDVIKEKIIPDYVAAIERLNMAPENGALHNASKELIKIVDLARATPNDYSLTEYVGTFKRDLLKFTSSNDLKLVQGHLVFDELVKLEESVNLLVGDSLVEVSNEVQKIKDKAKKQKNN